MKNFTKGINYNNLITRFLLIICLIYSPFIFFAFINETIRLSAFVLLLILLAIKLFFQKIKTSKIIKNIILLVFLITYCTASIFINYNTEGLRSSIGYSLILILSYLVFLNISSNFKFYEYISKNYIRLFNFIAISIIINFIINILTGSFNFLTPYFPNSFSYDYSASIFGLSIRKSLLGVNISRNFWFFIEPVYAAPFFLINIFIIGPCIKLKNRYFIVLNTIIGILSFSYLFFAGYLILFLLKNKPYILAILFSIMVFLLLYSNLDYEGTSLVSSSSGSDRLLRLNLAFEVLSKFSIQKLFFGSGYIFSQALEMGVSAGIFSSFIEGGIIGMIIPLIFILVYTKFNKLLFCIALLSLLTIEPYKMPFLLLAFIIAGKLISIKSDTK
jgi:hypothetical protein